MIRSIEIQTEYVHIKCCKSLWQETILLLVVYLSVFMHCNFQFACKIILQISTKIGNKETKTSAAVDIDSRNNRKIPKIMQKFTFVLCIVDNVTFLITPGLTI